MPQNQFLPIANAPSANALTPAQWAAMSTLLQQGFSSGEVLSASFNTFLRQFSVPISAIAQFMADHQSQDVLDDGSVPNFEAKFTAAFAAYISALIASQAGGYTDYYGADTSTTANTVVASIPNYGSSYVVGRSFRVKIANDSTAGSSIDINGIGAIPIRRQDFYGGTPFLTRREDLRGGAIAEFVYDGQFAQLKSPTYGNQSSLWNQSVAQGGSLSPSDLGSTIQLGVSPTTYTVYLPVQSACVNGGKLEFFCNSNQTPSLQVSGSDMIVWPDGTQSNSVLMKYGDTLTLVSTNVTNLWLAVSGSIFNRYTPDFARSLAANGYQKLPSGLIMQWGTATGATGGTVTVTLPIAFSTACYSVTATLDGASTSPVTVEVSALGTQSFGLTTVFNGSFAALPAHYIAIGK